MVKKLWSAGRLHLPEVNIVTVGSTLNHVLADIGSTVFTCGQAYVALSRVKSIEGLHLINFNPRSIKALDSAILEYNRLRKKFRSGLRAFIVPKRQARAVIDRQ